MGITVQPVLITREANISLSKDLNIADEPYRRQGFTRVADKCLDQLSGKVSVETAIVDLTDAGERVHPVDDEDDGPTPDLADQLRAASADGDAHEEFEKLVAKALSQLGCAAD